MAGEGAAEGQEKIRESVDNKAEKLKQLRKHYGLTQLALARKIGKSPSTISVLETGRLEMTDAIEKEICNAFGCDENFEPVDEEEHSPQDSEGIPARIKKVRGQISQRQFAKMVGCSNGQVSLVENGILVPSKDWIRKVAEKFDVSLGWLMTGDADADDVDGEIEIIERWLRKNPERRKELIKEIQKNR